MKNSRTVNYAVNVANLPIIFARKCADFAQCVCNLLAVPNVIICIVVYGYQDSGTTLFPRILWLKVMVNGDKGGKSFFRFAAVRIPLMWVSRIH